MRFGSRGPSVRHRNALTEIAWEDAVKGLGMEMSTVASEKNKEILFVGNVFYKQWHRCVLLHLCFEGTTSWKSQSINPQQEATLSLWTKISSPRERRKWSLGLGQHLKDASPNVRVSHTSREIKKRNHKWV